MPEQFDIGGMFPDAAQKPAEEITTPGEGTTPPAQDPNTQATATTGQPGEQNPGNVDNSTIKSMREALANKDREAQELKTKIEAIAKHLGKTPEEFLADKAKEDQATKAKALGITPELQAILDKQDQALQAMQEEKLKVRFNQNMDNLMQEFSLNEQQASEFLNAAHQRGFNVIDGKISHSDIYFSINREKIMAAEREKIRQETLNEVQTSGVQAPAPSVGGTNSGEGRGTLDDLLNDLTKK